MTGPRDTPPRPAPPTIPADDHEAADVAVYLAAEGVANDYHPDDLPPDHLTG